MALTLTRSADFAIDKPAGEPCRHLGADHGCAIHAELRPRGFPGCVAYDCFGAGQRVVATGAPRPVLVEIFPVARQLHEMLWCLDQAQVRPEAGDLDAELGRMYAKVDDLTRGSADQVLTLDVQGVRAEVGGLLTRVSERVRRPYDRATPTLGPGVDLRGRDLRGTFLRGALLIAADLRGADLRDADLLGADVRDARVDGADLSSALYLTQSQVNAVRGDARTRLPTTLDRPDHWTSEGDT
ncbi:MAG: pentapeptide repeat-containing protein [Propionibacteriaceae bacterium]